MLKYKINTKWNQTTYKTRSNFLITFSTVTLIIVISVWPRGFNISAWKLCKIEGKLVLITDRKSHMGFWLVPKSVTLNDLERRRRSIIIVSHVRPNNRSRMRITITCACYCVDRYLRACEWWWDAAVSSSDTGQRHHQRPSVDSVDAWLLGRESLAASRLHHHPQPFYPHHQRKVRHSIRVVQLSQRDRAAGWVSFGQTWKTGTGI